MPVGQVEPIAAVKRMATYDSTADTLQHIARIRELLAEVVARLQARGEAHDRSKLGPEEKPWLDELTPRLKSQVYGSAEYNAVTAQHRAAISRHYAANSHHPEFYVDGVGGMDLIDVIEMFCDWKAASERTRGGGIEQSLAINIEKFKIEPQLAAILRNTARSLFGAR